MEICRLENIKKTYGSDEKVTPIKQVSLSIKSGDFICIEGPSGVGKSTLLYIIGGLLNTSSGNVFIDGNNITTMKDKELTNLRRNKIGFLFQDTHLIQALTIEENLIFIQSMCHKKKNLNKVKELLTRLGLWERRNFLPSELSGGQKRRAMIACTIVKNPLLILADEPTNDLDEYWAEEILHILYEYVNMGKAVILVTHNEQWADKAQKRFILNKGILYPK
ncbi:ABC transporter ATP-binding protein [Tissierella praeacuta]|uniref:ABC transporter ATP-binding protein n=1 Tax=Tissierella praeacuta TaxID=43131 RepID=UPI001C0FC33E|nr:ABC transporter ATP-binding protein [Tissierella praeacuta]MBU5257098.1 ABC transporter ATP-binding protein [Tissierella praeacuta]